MRHDYTDEGWGHAIGYRDGGGSANGDPGKWMGHGPRDGGRIGRGDQIAVRMRSGRVGLYRVEEVEYFTDPRDMWSATVRWLGYEEQSS